MEFDINLYDPITEYEEKEKKEVSLKKLRSALKDRFDHSSALDGIKAQLRKQVLSKLLGKEELVLTGNESEDNNLKKTIANSCIFSYLKQHGLHSTLSVFTAESGMDSERNFVSDLDVSRMLKFNELSTLFRELHDYIKGRGDDNSAADHHPILTQLLEEDRTSLLDLILEYCLSLRSEMTKETSIQAGPSTFTARELLDNELLHLEKHYSDLKVQKLPLESRGFEERMIVFQRELEERKTREVDIQVRYFRENEVSKIRMEEANKNRLALEKMRQELEHDYSQRLKAHHEREQDALKRAKEQERISQANLYEARQQMEREIEDMRARESMLARKVDLEGQGLKLLEIRLKESQFILEQRERDARKLEEDANHKLHNAMEIARKDANLRLAKEFEELNALRYDITLEKRKFEEDKLTVNVDKEATRLLREEAQKIRELLATREGEVTILKWSLSQAQQQIQLLQQQQQFSKYPHPPEDEFLDMPGTPKSMQPQQRRPSGSAEAFFQQSPNPQIVAENQLLRQENEQLRARIDEADKILSTNQTLARDNDALKTDLHHEKARALGRDHKIEELQRLLQEKSQTIESLSRQLENDAKRDKPSPANATIATSTAATAALYQQPLAQQVAQLNPPLAALLQRLLLAESAPAAAATAAAAAPYAAVYPVAPVNATPWSSAVPPLLSVQPPPSQQPQLSQQQPNNYYNNNNNSNSNGYSSTVSGNVEDARNRRSPEQPNNQDMFGDISPIKPLSNNYDNYPANSTNTNSINSSSSGGNLLSAEQQLQQQRRLAAEQALQDREIAEKRRRQAIEDELLHLKEQEILRLKRAAQDAEEERLRVQAARDKEEKRLEEQQRLQEQQRRQELLRLSAPAPSAAAAAASAAVTDTNKNAPPPSSSSVMLAKQQAADAAKEAEAEREEAEASRARVAAIEERRQARLIAEAAEDARDRQMEEQRRLQREAERQERWMREQEVEKLADAQQQQKAAAEAARQLAAQRQQQQETAEKEEQEKQEQQRLLLLQKQQQQQQQLEKDQEREQEEARQQQQQQQQQKAQQERDRQTAEAAAAAQLKEKEAQRLAQQVAAENEQRRQQEQKQLEREREEAQRQKQEQEEREREREREKAAEKEAELKRLQAEKEKEQQEEDEIAEARRRVLERRKQKAAADQLVSASTDSLRNSWNNNNNSNANSTTNNNNSSNLNAAATSDTVAAAAAAATAVAANRGKPARPVFDFADESDSKIEFDANSDESSGNGW